MKKLFKRTTTIILALTMMLCTFAAINIPAANAADTTIIYYTLGEEYSGRTESNKYLQFTLKERSHLYVRFKETYGYHDVNIYDTNGNCVSDDSNTIVTGNDAQTEHTYSHSCNLNAGTYRVYITQNLGTLITNFVATAEPTVSLSTPSITGISSPNGGAFSVSYTGVANALNYQIQYSTNTSFSSAAIKDNASLNYTASGLAKGTYYYVRVRAFTVYNDGLRVYSNWSRAQSVYVKKLKNEVNIITSSKKVKYAKLKKKNKSFLIAAEDKANAPFTFKLSSVPKKAKKYISINKSTGKVTVKKGLKKGTYKIGVKVTAAATNSYDKASATKTITVKVS